ncbi:FHA domain-containing protein [Ectothiorhodospiraceae bacterium 2226]|nr:FHA domain-containing protein [Ectothiorhodospiraceae bacterium 2226]
MATITLSFKGTVIKSYPLEEGENLIGSDPECAIRIDSLAVAPRHARLCTRGRETTLEDLGQGDGTFVNHEPIAAATALADGDVVRVGKHTLTYLSGAQQSAADEDVGRSFEVNAPSAAWLQIMNGHNVGKTISLNRALTNIGKKGVQTAVIARRNGGFFLSHLEGPQSVLVQGAPLGDRIRRLDDQDVIQIGNVKMQFYLQS